MYSLLLAATLLAPKPVAVMVHGAGGGGWEYRTWKPVFEKAGYQVIALDLMPAKGGLGKTTLGDYVNQIVKAGGQRPSVLIGASMGGVLILKATERMHPRAMVLVCSTQPYGVVKVGPAQEPFPPVIKWANGPYKDTVDSMPDSDEATRRYAWPRWRDESGAVLNAIRAGVKTAKPGVPCLSVIPEADDTVPVANQQALATWAGADTLRFKGMSHVGPLLSRRSSEVASAVVGWLKAR